MKETFRRLENKTSYIILAVGALVRLIYVLGSSIYERQYDIGQIDLSAGAPVSGGHLGYIQYLSYYHQLPDVDPTTVYQFHHPPLHHMLCALWIELMKLFSDNYSVIEESIQIIPFAASLVTLYAAYKVLLRFNIEGKGLHIALLIFAFHPSLILMSGSINNDCLALMFSFLCVLYSLRWIDSRAWKDILLLAVFLGLGISTKQNVAELAFPLAVIFVMVLVKQFKLKESVACTFIQYIVFGLISIPLGIWFYIRNLIKYNVSLLWVYELPTDSWQYTGNYPVFNRFLWPIPSEMISNLLHFKIGCGYNVWMQIMRTSVTGEWDMASVSRPIKLVAVLMMFCAFALAIIAFIYFCKSFFSSKALNNYYRIYYLVAYFVVMLMYLKFVYDYPQECSMSFRYIEIVLMFQITALELQYDKISTKWVKYLINSLLIAFVILSLALCLAWCIY